MIWYQAIIMGIIQGFTEFLPISSDGHLELAKVLLNLEKQDNLTFVVVVHGATVLSILVVFFQEILLLLKGLFKIQWNSETQYLSKIAVSMIPVLFVGLFFKDFVEGLFNGNMLLTGSMLMLTGLLLTISYYVKPRNKDISYLHAFIIGISQAFAVLPGLSRSGSTISTGLMLGNKKEELTKFSFLMVLVPIIGANLLDLMDSNLSESISQAGSLNLLIGFISAFITGLFACKWMIGLVKKGKLIWFGIYCLVIGLITIILF